MNAHELMNNIRMLQFTAIDLNLYLDNFPDNDKAQQDYAEVSKKLANMINAYECKYGPLTNFGTSHEISHSAWVNQPWPWETM